MGTIFELRVKKTHGKDRWGGKRRWEGRIFKRALLSWIMVYWGKRKKREPKGENLRDL